MADRIQTLPGGEERSPLLGGPRDPGGRWQTVVRRAVREERGRTRLDFHRMGREFSYSSLWGDRWQDNDC